MLNVYRQLSLKYILVFVYFCPQLI